MNNILKNYKPNDIIFLLDLYNSNVSLNKDCIRKQVERLVDKKKLLKYSTGIYYIPSYSITGKLNEPNINKVITKKYISSNDEVFGFYSGITLLYNLGISNQIPNIKEIVTNKESSRKRVVSINDFNVIIRKPVVEITNSNYKILQLLDLLKYVDKYRDISKNDVKQIIYKNYLNYLSMAQIDKYLSYYPAKVSKIFMEYKLYEFTQQ